MKISQKPFLLPYRPHILFNVSDESQIVVISPGIEPGSPVPQTEILSVELRDQLFYYASNRLHCQPFN